ncbi:MAG: sigma-70 family RNA polymerase sigma factor [Ruminococcaceae bacterium]|nr:sigma-70 family RNA polymerase sigma factor [Oscillospiraceae bacterium]
MRETERVVETYGTMVYRVCYMRLAPVDMSLIDDAYQNVFLTYIEHPPKNVEKNSEHEKAWFLRCAVHRCTDICRNIKRHSTDEIPDTAPAEQENTSEVIEILLGLPEKYRMPLYLHCICGYSIEETSKALDMSQPAFRMRLTRARRAFAEIWGEK